MTAKQILITHISVELFFVHSLEIRRSEQQAISSSNLVCHRRGLL